MSLRQTAVKKLLWEQVTDITNQLRDYWPLTLRQIYYQLVAAEYIDNNQAQYQMLSKQLTRMRNQGRLSWAVMEDRTRSAVEKECWTNKTEYIRLQLEDFLTGYQRCLIQQQEKHVELWVEKDALSRIFQQVANTLLHYHRNV